MRKIVKKAKKCSKCNHIIKNQEEDIFCDTCQTLVRDKREYELYLTIFFETDFPEIDSEDHEFCSWKCLKEFLRKLPKEKKKKIGHIYLPDISGKDFDKELSDFLGK